MEHIMTGAGGHELFDAIGDITGVDAALEAAAETPATEEAAETLTTVQSVDLEGQDTKEAEETEETEEVEETEEAEATDDDNAEAEATPTIKAKVGDEEIEIPENARIEVKVNGKIQEVSLEDLKAGYAGTTEIRRRFSELDVQRKGLEEQRTQWAHEQRMIQGHLELMSTLQGEELVYYLAEMSGKNPQAVVDDMRRQVVALLKEFEGVPDHARQKIYEAKQIQLANKVSQARQMLGQKIQQADQQISEQQQWRQAMFAELEKNHLSQQEFADACNEIASRIDAGELDGQWTERDVITYARDKKVLTVIDETATSILGKTAEDDLVDYIQTAIEVEERKLNKVYNPDQIAKITKKILKHEQQRTQQSLTKNAKITKKANSTQVNERREIEDAEGSISSEELLNFMTF